MFQLSCKGYINLFLVDTNAVMLCLYLNQLSKNELHYCSIDDKWPLPIPAWVSLENLTVLLDHKTEGSSLV